jgi:hypothetical protein
MKKLSGNDELYLLLQHESGLVKDRPRWTLKATCMAPLSASSAARRALISAGVWFITS